MSAADGFLGKEDAVSQTATQVARTLHLTNPLMSGDDVKHAQELLATNPFGDFQPGTVDGQYGPATAEATRRAKLALGFPDERVDGSFGKGLLAYLAGTKALPPDFKARAADRAKQAGDHAALRDKIVGFARWGIANEPQIHYQELRPMDGLDQPKKLPLRTDCSGFTTLCYKWAGAPDPNGLNFNGSGYTGTMLQHGRQIAQSAARPADLVVWGPPPGHHVALVLETGTDPLLCSHGSEDGPKRISLSVETQYQPKPVTWLTCL